MKEIQSLDKNTLPEFGERELEIVPLERSETIPSSWYTDPRFHQIDKQFIFARTWQYVGRLSWVERPGDYFLATVAENPIIVVRGKDDMVRAFFNVCRHRGGPLAIEERGSSNALQCKYHGWTYTLEGMLRGVPQFDRVELFDRKDFGLIRIDLQTWEGLVLVNLSKSIRLADIDLVLKGIVERIAPERLTAKKFYKRVSYDVNCNWKVYVDNYLEGYHIPLVHPDLESLLEYKHYVTETFDYYSLQHSPISDEGKIYGSGQAFYYFVFPNFMLNILPGRLQTNLVVPITHSMSKVIFDYYYDDVSSPEALKKIEEDIAYSDKIQQEDIEICEHVQKGLKSMAYDKGRFSVEMEKGVYHFQSLLKKAYREALTT